ncbi:type 4a pilus biogenesis protein PilO [Halobacteriovorax sp. HLS]|uniref:type 4a pilus biogenesis protein PilO n=1 Tax=Halobacteriovorax sp. HLS TaxID=2234000 RepID=UPI000FDC7141|nr:type 4a pilus biogenesis protein PilO [Halobacteriovorax sp. HLS]
MKLLISKIHYFIFIYIAFGVYTHWLENNEKIESELAQVPVIQNKIRKAKKEKKQLNSYLKDVEAAKGRIELVAKEIENLQKKLPNTIDDTKNLSNIKNIAEQINIKNIYLTPLDEIDKGFYMAKRYNFKASGTYLQFLLLMEKIGAESTILNVKRLFLENVQKKQRGRFQIINGDVIIETYRYNENYKEDRGIQAIENEFKNKTKKKVVKPRKRRKKR